MENDLAKTLILLFKYCNKADDKELFEFYYSQLKSGNAEKICNRIQEIMRSQTDTYLPAIGNILNHGSEDKADIIKAWGIFCKTKANNSLAMPIPDWVYTIIHYIGQQRCHDATDEDMIWIKKEFENIYPLIKSGQIAIIKDPREGQYIKISEGVTMLLENINQLNSRPEIKAAYQAGKYQVLLPEENWSKEQKLIAAIKDEREGKA